MAGIHCAWLALDLRNIASMHMAGTHRTWLALDLHIFGERKQNCCMDSTTKITARGRTEMIAARSRTEMVAARDNVREENLED